MRIDIVAIGSLGDVRPAVALGVGLLRDGHQVRVVTLDGCEDLVCAQSLRHLVIGSSAREIADTTAGDRWVRGRGNTRGFLRGFVAVVTSLIGTGIDRYWRHVAEVEAIVTTPMGLLVGMHVAERLGVPLIQASFVPTRHDWLERRKFMTRIRRDAAAAVFRQLFWMKLRRTTNAARFSVLSLPPLPLAEPFSSNTRTRMVLEAYSPAVVPRPRDRDRTHVTGYWFLDDHASWQPSAELADFLKEGAPPVFVGFGSTPFPDAGAATDAIVTALRLTGNRGVLLAGGSGLATGRLADHVLSLDSVPHSWLLPRVSAAVHHGGAGVTGAVLRAGLPSVIVPIFGDQPFWGERVFALGAGPQPIPARALTADSLAGAISRTSDIEMRRRAADVGARIAKEDGVARAVELIDECLGVRNGAQRAS
jgi:sterol 3beta-glucosyltransferase